MNEHVKCGRENLRQGQLMCQGVDIGRKRSLSGNARGLVFLGVARRRVSGEEAGEEVESNHMESL